jgi:hypothetical protein
MKTLLLLISTILLLSSCTENYSDGERIGFIPKFSERGLVYKSYEGELNLTQTGANTSSTFAFSVDNDKNNPELIAKVHKALLKGYKVKIHYKETFGKNWFNNRGETDHFIDDCQYIDTNVNHVNNPVLNTVLKSDSVDENTTTVFKGEVIFKGKFIK